LDYILSRAIAKDPAERYQRGMEMVLDIQELREGREPWSKAKHPDSAPSLTQAQTSKNIPSPLSQLTSGARYRGNVTAIADGRATQRLLEHMRKQSFAGALLVIGLIIFGVRIEHSLRPHKDATRKAVSAPIAAAPLPSPAVPISTPASKEHKIRKVAPQLAVSKPLTSATGDKVALSPAKLTPPANGTAMLEIEVDHKFADAHMAIWVDEELTYTHPLQGIEKKRLVVFHRVQGHEFHAVQVSPGKHLLKVQVSPGAGAIEQSGTVQGLFVRGSEKMLRIQFGKSGEMALSLE
jgi:hypothetical protein